MEEENEVAPTGPLDERLVHKTWKWRVCAYEELENLFKQAEDTKDPIFNRYESFFKKILGDVNPAAQEKGLDVVLAFIDRADSIQKHAGGIAPLLVEKGFSAARPKTKEKSSQALLQLVEADSPDPVVENLIKGASHKVPKISAASIATLREALRLFGAKVIPLKPVVKEFPAWFENRDKAVRVEASSMVVEMYRWLGKALNQAVESLTAVQAKELQEAFEKLPDEPVVPVKYMRSQAPKPGQIATAQAQGIPAEPAVIDAYDLVSEVNILGKIKDDWFENLASPKWQIRSEQVDKLIELANAPRLEQGDYGEVAASLKKLLQDMNIMVVSKAAKAVGLLGTGLRLGFSVHARMLLPFLLEKLKEKKISVMTAVNEALDILAAFCFVIAEALEDISAACANKVPQVREGTLNWLTKAVVIPKQAQQIMKCIKPLCNILVAALDDGSSDVRDAAAKTFGALAGVVGERAISPYLAKLDPIKAKKVKDNFPQVMPSSAPLSASASEEKAGVEQNNERPAGKEKAKVEKLPEAPSISRPTTTRPAKPAAPGSAEEKPMLAAPKKLPAKKLAAKAAPPKAAAKPVAGDKGKAKVTAKGSDEDLSPKMTKEQALAKAAEVLPSSVLTNLEDKNWKQRLAGIEELTACVAGMSQDVLSGASDAIVQQLEQKPGWKESNFQVLSGVFSLIAKIALADPKFSRRTAAVVTGALGEKLTDIKIRNSATECLNNFVEASSPQFVFSQLYQHTAGHKNPKVTSETLVWMSKALEDFGAAGLDIKMLLDHLKSCLEASNAPTKAASTKVLVVLRILVGPGLCDFLSDVKKQLLDAIEKEFDKVKDAKPNPPSRTFREVSSLSGGTAGGMGELPRTDISGKLTQKLLKDLGDAQWKTRQAALEQIEAIVLEANRRIEPKLGSLMGLLKARLADSNQKICAMTLYLIGLLANAVGPAYDKSAKIIIPAVLTGLADNKKPIRDATLTTLDQLVVEVGLDPFVSLLPAAMLIDSSLGRKEVLQWVMKFLPAFKPRLPIEMKEFIKPLLSCAQDKQGDVRHLAESVFGEIVKHVGFEAIKRECKDLKPASQQLINPIIEKLRVTAAAAVAAAPPATTVTTTVPVPTLSTVSAFDSVAPIVQVSAPVSAPSSVVASSLPKPALTSSQSSTTSGRSVVTEEDSKEKTGMSRIPSKGFDKPPPKVPARSPSRGSTRSRDSEPPSPSSVGSSGSGGSGGSSTLLYANDFKEERKAKERKLAWAFDNPRQEFIDALSQQAQGVMNPALHNKMFNTDNRGHQKALEDLSTHLESGKQETIDNLDIILKWCTLRLFDSNAASFRKNLAYLESLFVMLAAEEFHMSDYEAYVFIPLLIERSGANSSDPIRMSFRTIFKQLGSITFSHHTYTNNIKMFKFVMEGLKSKNWRTKVECLEELASLLNRQGLGVCNPGKAFSTIATNLADKDPAVRSATLNTFLQAFLCTGDELWKYIPGLPENHRNMLEAHIKRVAESAVASPSRPASGLGTSPTRSKSTGNIAAAASKSPRRSISPSPSNNTLSLSANFSSSLPASSPIPRSRSDFKLDFEKIGGFGATTHEMPALAPTDLPIRGDSTPRLPTRSKEQSLSVAMDWAGDDQTSDSQLDMWLQHINDADGSDHVDAIETLKFMLLTLKQGASFTNSACDRMITALTRLAKKAFNYFPFSPRMFKYVFGVICQIAKQQALYSAVTHEPLFELLKFSLELALPISKDLTEEDKKLIHSSAKDFLVCGLDCCGIVVAFSVLLHSMSLPESRDFLDLAIRLYMRHAKRLSATAALLDRSSTILLLQDANTFFIPFANSVRGEDPEPRAVKSMLNELVKGQKRSDILECAASIPSPAPIYPIIHQIIRDNDSNSGPPSSIKTLALNVSIPTVSTTLLSPFNNGQQAQISTSEKRELQEIFRRVVNRDTAKQGMSELHAFCRAHQHVDISPLLAQTSEHFQKYIKRQLEILDNGGYEESNASDVADMYLEKLRDIQSRCGLAVVSNHGPTQPSTPHNNKANISSTNLASISEIKQRIKSATDMNMQIYDKENNTPQAPTSTSSIADIRQRLARMKAT